MTRDERGWIGKRQHETMDLVTMLMVRAGAAILAFGGAFQWRLTYRVSLRVLLFQRCVPGETPSAVSECFQIKFEIYPGDAASAREIGPELAGLVDNQLSPQDSGSKRIMKSAC